MRIRARERQGKRKKTVDRFLERLSAVLLRSFRGQHGEKMVQ